MPAASSLGASRWIFVFYLGLLVWAPIPLGSNRAWAWGLMNVSALLLSLAWLAGYLRGKWGLERVLIDAWPAMVCALVWLLYVWLQLLPVPLGLLEWLSPEAARWHAAAAAPEALRAAPLTLDPYGTLEAACKSTAYIAFFALSLLLLANRDRARYTAYTLIVSGVLQAWYGGVVQLQFQGFAASGTFVNRNHYAAYLVMCLSIGIGVLIASLTGGKSRSWGDFFQRFIQWIITPKMALRLGLVIMVIALVLTRSRMGNLSFFFGMLVAGLIALALSQRATRSMVILLVSLIVCDVLIVGTYFGTQQVIERIAASSTETDDRDEVAEYALGMWRDYPVLGSGLGSFPVVFPRYSKDGTSAAYTHAHNDYLEFAAEAGGLGIVLLGLFVLLSFAAALRAQYVRSDPFMRGLSFAAMMAIVALMIHSAVDFSLQIPANSLTFMVVLAFAWVSLLGPGAEKGGVG